MHIVWSAIVIGFGLLILGSLGCAIAMPFLKSISVPHKDDEKEICLADHISDTTAFTGRRDGQ